ncbi:CLPB [Bugula neritina]|uniref:CLPB n=1 Tax=Bugula neritina TaxID=10212 RepID=A0A7J7JK48_BUGNE|nr:CLPB [Bugula neritina]
MENKVLVLCRLKLKPHMGLTFIYRHLTQRTLLTRHISAAALPLVLAQRQKVFSSHHSLTSSFQGRKHYHKHGTEDGSTTTTITSSLALLTWLFLKDRVSVAAAEDEKTRSANLLFISCKNNDLEAVRKLINSGVDVNCKHRFGWTPLMVAAINGHYTVVKLLLAAKANPNLADGFSTSAILSNTMGISRKEIQNVRDTEFSPLLSLHSFKGSTALHYAALADDDKIMSALIDTGADPTLVNAQGFRPAQFADPRKNSMFQKWEKEYEATRKAKEAEMRRRFPLEKRLKERLVGQEGAINVVSSAVRRKENGWFDSDHPLVMLFLGSSGIGKTELAKQLANYMHGEKREAFIRIDMSEYQSKHEAAKFIGAPPGYVGHEEGGQLTERLSKFPSAVVLFDEVDKAHPDVLTTLLQLFDEGHMTDGKGKRVDCKDATFIMTANVANEEISNMPLTLESQRRKYLTARQPKVTSQQLCIIYIPEISREFKDTIIHPILKAHFKRDEFLGRINEIVYFLPFNTEELNRLVTRQLNFWAGKAYSVHKIELTWDSEVVSLLAKGFDIHYGARSIIYEVERKVIGKLASLQEIQKIGAKDKLHLSIRNHDIIIEKLNSSGKFTPVSN